MIIMSAYSLIRSSLALPTLLRAYFIYYLAALYSKHCKIIKKQPRKRVGNARLDTRVATTCIWNDPITQRKSVV